MIRHNVNTYDHGNLAGSIFTEEEITKISVALSYNHTLVILSLSSIALNDAGVALICEALEGNNVLVELKLDFNTITDAGAQCIATTLLRDNYTAGNRNELLADQTNHKNNISLLSLQYNMITDVGVRSLADALTVNTVLKTLNVGGNPIGIDGVALFAQGNTLYIGGFD